MSDLTPEALDTIERDRIAIKLAESYYYTDVWEDFDEYQRRKFRAMADVVTPERRRLRTETREKDVVIRGLMDLVGEVRAERDRLRTENEEQAKRVDNLLGEQVAGIRFMRERDALKAKLDAAVAALSEGPMRSSAVLKVRAALTGEATT